LTAPNRSVFLRLAGEINIVLERHFRLFAALFVMLLMAYAVVKDVRTRMWADELVTLYMSQQASPGEIAKATLEGCDGLPPLYATIVHAIQPWVWPEVLAVRLPATLGFCGMVLFLLTFCHRRLPAAYSLVAALLACNACLEYSTEGRSYGVVLGCAAGALLCWQSASDGRGRILAIPLLAFWLALMTAMHYYSVFFFVPLFVAEMVRWRKSGKLDVAVLAAMAAPLLVLGLHYPFIAATRQFQEHHWSPAVWGHIRGVYSAYFVTMCLPPLVVLALFSRMPDDRDAASTGLTVPEWVAAGGFALMPLCVIVLSKYTTHVFVARYTLWAVPGIAGLVIALSFAAAHDKSAVGVSMLGLLVALMGFYGLNSLRKKPALSNGEAVRQELVSLSDGSEPIVVANTMSFLELSYYAAPGMRERLIYPLSRDLDLRYLGYDSDALAISALSHRSKLHIIDYDAVLAAHARFILAAAPDDYLPWHLVKEGYRVVPIGSSTVPLLFEVEAPSKK
jgi:hypothetical protein